MEGDAKIMEERGEEGRQREDGVKLEREVARDIEWGERTSEGDYTN